ncbi:MAG: STAS domain-containing protein [Chitinivibrionales bacterium]
MNVSVSQQPPYTIVKVGGRIDWEQARELDELIRSLIDEGNYQLVFELDEITFISSGGIGALVYNLKTVKNYNGSMYLIASSKYMNFIFETLKFHIIFEGNIFSSIQQFQKNLLDNQE